MKEPLLFFPRDSKRERENRVARDAAKMASPAFLSLNASYLAMVVSETPIPVACAQKEEYRYSADLGENVQISF